MTTITLKHFCSLWARRIRLYKASRTRFCMISSPESPEMKNWFWKKSSSKQKDYQQQEKVLFIYLLLLDKEKEMQFVKTSFKIPRPQTMHVPFFKSYITGYFFLLITIVPFRNWFRASNENRTVRYSRKKGPYLTDFEQPLQIYLCVAATIRERCCWCTTQQSPWTFLYFRKTSTVCIH